MIYKLFILSFVFFSMFISDSHSAIPGDRYCRTTGCDTRPIGEVFDQCRREYGSNRIRPQPCGGGRSRYQCCTTSAIPLTGCLDLPCAKRVYAETEKFCREQLRTSNIRILVNACGNGNDRYRCCLAY